MFTADQLVLHLIGDYVTQSHWMAEHKTKRFWPAEIHAFLYTVPFLLLTHSWRALLVINVTHFFIDRFRLARYVTYLKNVFLQPHGQFSESQTSDRWMWVKCSKTGFPEDVPPWLAVWLLIIVDNIMHIVLNGLALHYL